jgi:hypothetical protein
MVSFVPYPQSCRNRSSSLRVKRHVSGTPSSAIASSISGFIGIALKDYGRYTSYFDSLR